MEKLQINSNDKDQVLFITSTKVMKPGVELHGAKESILAKSVKEVKEDWEKMMQHLSSIVANTKDKLTNTGYELDEITVGLGFNVSGRLAFIAEAGVEASIEVKFKKVEN